MTTRSPWSDTRQPVWISGGCCSLRCNHHPILDLDGGAAKDGLKATAIHVKHAEILDKVSRVVFISVPQYGTNIADWVRGHALLRRGVIEGLYRGVQGASIPPLEKGICRLLDELAKLTKQPDMLKAAQDALNETNTSRTDAVQRADAEEAGSELRLWLQHMDHDFGVIDDLASFTNPPANSTSAAGRVGLPSRGGHDLRLGRPDDAVVDANSRMVR
jgi:hypothetical protein